MPRDLRYERDNVGVDEQYPDGDGIKCKNYIVCGEVLPSWWYSCKNRYLCTNCDWAFGTWSGMDATSGAVEFHTGKGELPVLEDAECPVCLETGAAVTQPRCEHHVCVACFKRCYYGPEPIAQPDFPYARDVEDQYDDDDVCSDEWYATYPLVREYEAALDACEDLDAQRFASEDNLRCCPLCRK